MSIQASSLVRDGKALGVTDLSLFERIAFGIEPNATAWSKTGYNPDVGTTEEDLWALGSTYVWPSSPQQMEVYSANAADTAAGTGVQSVHLYYLDAAGVDKVETIALNGGVVATTATNILRVQAFRAATCGTGKKAAGNIDVRAIADTPVYSRIALGYTRARNTAYRVPAGKTLYVTSIVFSAVGTTAGKYARFTTRASYDDKGNYSLDFMVPYHEVLVQDGAFYRVLEIPTRLPQNTDILVSALAGAASTICTSILRGYLVTG